MIENSIQLGDPVEHRGVMIAPLFPRNDPRAEYLTLEEALPLGFRITEVDEAGSVPGLGHETADHAEQQAVVEKRERGGDPGRDPAGEGGEGDDDVVREDRRRERGLIAW